MFARNVSIHLKPNSSVAFTKQIENETVPMLRKQEGFQGELTFLVPGGTEAVAISLWDKKENAEAYARSGYPEVLKNLNKFVEGTPKIQTYEVANSTFHKVAATIVA
jgi:heme-degrading monooxygenase HmoA